MHSTHGIFEDVQSLLEGCFIAREERLGFEEDLGVELLVLLILFFPQLLSLFDEFLTFLEVCLKVMSSLLDRIRNRLFVINLLHIFNSLVVMMVGIRVR